MNRIELRMRYKAETSRCGDPMNAYARKGKHGNIILDQYALDSRIDAMIPDNGDQKEVLLADPEYVLWLEEKAMEMLK